MKRRIPTLMILALFGVSAHAQAQSGWSAQFVDSAIEGPVVLLDFGGPYVFDPASHSATLSDGSVSVDLSNPVLLASDDSTGGLIQATAIPTGPIGGNVYLNVELKDFKNSKGTVVLNDPHGAKNFLLVIASRKKDQLYTVNVAVPAKGSVRLVAGVSSAPVRNQLTIQIQNDDSQLFFQSLSRDIRKVLIFYDFGPDATVSNVDTRAKHIDPPPTGGTAVTIYPADPFPFHATPYKVSIQIPKTDLPKGMQAAVVGDTYKITASANFPSPTVTETAADYDFQPTFTSAVNQAKQTRTNTGLFILTVKPVLFLHQQNVDGRPRRYSYWTDFRPNISANVDTQPEKSSSTPNRVTIALDSELGFTRQRAWGRPAAGAEVVPAASGGQAFDQFTWTNGVRTDTDRDFKIFSTYWHTDLAFDLWKWSESQAFRTQNLTPAGTASHAVRTPLVTAYRFRPSFGYDLGSTTVRSGTLNPVLGSSVSRTLVKLDTMLEIRRNVTFSVVDTGYYLFNATHRNARDYLTAQIAVNTGLLLRLDTNKIQSAIAFTYQRGEQPPLFKSVDTISLGLKLYK